ncbi:MAG: 2-amino-4-hydroxy-6-hydroxymethyldihydropteridine diphosphokinase [Steroidobacteraceae bacterium]
MSTVFVAIGSNIDPAAHLLQAARALKQRFPDARFSGCYRNSAFGFEGDDFVNAVVGFDTELPIPQLLTVLRGIEALCGRGKADPRWGPRAIDLDLLLYDRTVENGVGYTVPRPDLTKRAYMLGPLAELAPQWLYPPAGPTIGELWARFARAEHVLHRDALDLNAL